MGSILAGDLDDRLAEPVDLSTTEGRDKIAAGRLSLLMMVMLTRSLMHCPAREHEDIDQSENKCTVNPDF